MAIRRCTGSLCPNYHADLRVEQAEIAAHSSATSGRKKWKQDGVDQLKDPEEQAVPVTDNAMYADM